MKLKLVRHASPENIDCSGYYIVDSIEHDAKQSELIIEDGKGKVASRVAINYGSWLEVILIEKTTKKVEREMNKLGWFRKSK